jgi:hypothetical protein
VGANAGSNITTADNVICIGTDLAGANVSNSCYIANIFGQISAGGIGVRINSQGKLGMATSSKRFKEDIESMDKASETLFSLEPVTFRYKEDNTRTPEFGLVAEEVAEVDAALVVRDREGKPYTVRYDAVNAMLLNEFLKEHRKVEKQEATISQLRSTVAQQQKDSQATVAQLTRRLDEQAAQIQKVSAQFAAANPSLGGLEASKLAPQVAENNQ